MNLKKRMLNQKYKLIFICFLLIAYIWIANAGVTLTKCISQIQNASQGQVSNVLNADPLWAAPFEGANALLPITLANITFQKQQIIAGGCYGIIELSNTTQEQVLEKGISGKPRFIDNILLVLMAGELCWLIYSFGTDKGDKNGNDGKPETAQGTSS